MSFIDWLSSSRYWRMVYEQIRVEENCLTDMKEAHEVSEEEEKRRREKCAGFGNLTSFWPRVLLQLLVYVVWLKWQSEMRSTSEIYAEKCYFVDDAVESLPLVLSRKICFYFLRNKICSRFLFVKVEKFSSWPWRLMSMVKLQRRTPRMRSFSSICRTWRSAVILPLEAIFSLISSFYFVTQDWPGKFERKPQRGHQQR